MVKPLTFTLCLLSLVVFGKSLTQTGAYRGAAVPQVSVSTFSPTNLTGITNLSWLIADGQALTNSAGSLSNWLDAGVSPQVWTNLGAATSWGVVSNNQVNGHAMVKFTKLLNQYIKANAYTSAQPHTVVLAMRYTQTTNAAQILFDSKNTPQRNAAITSAAGRMQLFAGSQVGATVFQTNTWMVLEFLFNTTGSAIFLNNVSSGALNANVQPQHGFILGSSFTLTGGPLDLAEMLTYSTALGAVDTVGTFSDATERYAVYNYLTNKYNIAQ